MTRDELLRTLGRPSRVGFVGWQNQTVWNYRLSEPLPPVVSRSGWAGRHRRRHRLRPRPLCDDDDDRPMMGLIWRHR